MQRDIQTLSRAAQIIPATINAEARTADVIFSTGAEGLQRNIFGESFFESLSLEPDAVRLNRLNNGAPLLIDHNQYSINGVIGVIESAKVDGERGTARVRFSTRPEVDPIFKDVQEGILRNLSVGYRVYQYERQTQENGIDKLRAIDWEPMEISLVPIGFDDGAKVRSNEKTNTVQITNKEERKHAKEVGKMNYDALLAKRYAGESLTVDENKFVDTELEKRAKKNLDATQAEAKYNDGLEIGKKRVLEIQNQCRTAGLDEKVALEIASACNTVEEANSEIVKRYVENHKKKSPEITSHIRVEDSASNMNYMDAMANALLHRSNPSQFKLTEDGKLFRGMSLSDMLKSNLDKNGISYRGMTTNEMMRRGMMTSSDFPILLDNVANKTLRAAYEQTPQTFRPLVREVTVRDFKPVIRVQLGDHPRLEKVNEHGEFTHAGLTEASESYSIDTFGRILAMTRQMLINDDLAAFTRIAELWGRAAADLESDVVWNLILSNPILSDGKAVFHADHLNFQAPNATKGKLDADTLSAARKALRTQKSLDGKRVNVIGSWLVVPAELETTAEKLMTPIVPNKTEDINIFSNRYQIIVEPRLDEVSTSAWYIVASPMSFEGIEIAFLEGERGVQLDRQDGFSIDGVQFKARLDFGAAFIDHRSWYKNGGLP